MLEIAAENLLYDKGCLAVPAGKLFTITFDNKEADVSHNVEILDHPGGSSLFTGKIISGPRTITYKVEAFKEGTYCFRCTVHPLRMSGTLLVGG